MRERMRNTSGTGNGMDPARGVFCFVQVAGMDGSGMLAQPSSLPRMQRRLYFCYYCKRNLLGTFRADVQPHGTVQSGRKAALVQSSVCKKLDGSLARSENAEIADWNGGELL